MYFDRLCIWSVPDSLYIWKAAWDRHQKLWKRKCRNHQYLTCIWHKGRAVLCGALFGKAHPEELYLLKLYAATGAILGHNFPFYLHFKGGKGIAATAGLVLSFHPTFIPVGVVLFFGAFLLTHYVSLGSLLVYAGIMIQMVVSGQMGLFHTSQGILNEMYIITAFLTIMAYYKHRENIKRLLKGEERKTYLTKKNKEAIK